MSDGRSVGDPTFVRRAFTEFHRTLLDVRTELTGGGDAFSAFDASDSGDPAAAARGASAEVPSARVDAGFAGGAPPQMEDLPGPGDPLLGEPSPLVTPSSPPASGNRAPAPSSAGSAGIRRIQDRFIAVLDDQRRQARWLGARDRAALEEAQYVMVALADEVLLRTEWPGRSAWRDDLLEMRVFGTHVAGERVFERAEALLRAERGYAQAMAEVYLLAISLGFEGRYRASPERGRLDELAAQLLALKGPRLRGTGSDHILPRAYASSVEGDAAVHLPRTRMWMTVLALSVVFYAVVTTLAWRDVSQPLRDIEQRLRDVVTSVKPPPRTP